MCARGRSALGRVRSAHLRERRLVQHVEDHQREERVEDEDGDVQAQRHVRQVECCRARAGHRNTSRTRHTRPQQRAGKGTAVAVERGWRALAWLRARRRVPVFTPMRVLVTRKTPASGPAGARARSGPARRGPRACLTAKTQSTATWRVVAGPHFIKQLGHLRAGAGCTVTRLRQPQPPRFG